jgi:hypothetical protein
VRESAAKKADEELWNKKYTSYECGDKSATIEETSRIIQRAIEASGSSPTAQREDRAARPQPQEWKAELGADGRTWSIYEGDQILAYDLVQHRALSLVAAHNRSLMP